MFLLDTHLVLWAALEPARLSAKALQLLDRLLVAQAVVEKHTLLTSDKLLAGYGKFVRVV